MKRVKKNKIDKQKEREKVTHFVIIITANNMLSEQGKKYGYYFIKRFLVLIFFSSLVIRSYGVWRNQSLDYTKLNSFIE